MNIYKQNTWFLSELRLKCENTTIFEEFSYNLVSFNRII